MSYSLILRKNEMESVEYFCKNNDIDYTYWSFDSPYELVFQSEQDRDKVKAFLKRLRQ